MVPRAFLACSLLAGCIFPSTSQEETVDTGAGPPGGWDTGDFVGELQAGDMRCGLPSEEALRVLDGGSLPAGPGPCREAELVRVDWVADGDTIHVTRQSDGGEEDVRIIGVDTPETWGGTECYGPEASDFTAAAVEGRLVWLSFDYDCEDDFDRTLAYVHLSSSFNCFLERLLLRGGFADVMTFSATSTWSQTFEQDEQWARAMGEGMWGACY